MVYFRQTGRRHSASQRKKRRENKYKRIREAKCGVFPEFQEEENGVGLNKTGIDPYMMMPCMKLRNPKEMKNNCPFLKKRRRRGIFSRKVPKQGIKESKEEDKEIKEGSAKERDFKRSFSQKAKGSTNTNGATFGRQPGK